MNIRSCTFAFGLFLSLALPASAVREPAAAAEPEAAGKDLVKNIDGWLGQITEKLESDKPITPEDLDSVFGDSFFSDSEDPERDLELVQQRVNSRLPAKSGQFTDSYSKWLSKKMSPADLDPQVVPDKGHITVNLKAPRAEGDSIKITVDHARIKINFIQKEALRLTHSDGTVSSSPHMTRRQRIMAVPPGADPAKYRLRTGGNVVSIIFDRKKGAKITEASK